jgi:hypothetical protein
MNLQGGHFIQPVYSYVEKLFQRDKGLISREFSSIDMLRRLPERDPAAYREYGTAYEIMHNTGEGLL